MRVGHSFVVGRTVGAVGQARKIARPNPPEVICQNRTSLSKVCISSKKGPVTP